jgi:hypothetical protein
MNKVSLTVATLLIALTGSAFAQNSTGITTSRDPAKAAAVEQRAADIKAQPKTTVAAKPAMNATKHVTKHHAKKRAVKHTVKKQPVKKQAVSTPGASKTVTK